jgi:hypothetical protein
MAARLMAMEAVGLTVGKAGLRQTDRDGLLSIRHHRPLLTAAMQSALAKFMHFLADNGLALG